MNTTCPRWLKDAVIYSLYPQSFYDSDGDGIGDLRGITEKLSYIKELGCTAIWMNPIFESDFLDAGYDVKDFYRIAPRYGTEADLVALCEQAHAMGLKVLLDLVAGHTADNSPWFLESAKSEDNPERDRFIWAPEMPKGYQNFKKNPNGPGYFMYNYYDVQPALNYGFATVTEPWQLPVDHPTAVENQNELIRIMDYWFKLGVDGFRVDMAASLIKNDPDKQACMKFWQRIRAWMEENYPENVLISEWSRPDRSIPGGFHMDMMIHNTNSCLTTLFRHEYFAQKLSEGGYLGESYFRKEALGSYDVFLAEYMPFFEATKDIGYMSFITGSHDIKRWSLGRDSEDIKVAYAFILTMPGVPINYYGDEIGMQYLHITTKEGGRDRTGSRTPMQWDDSKNHGFSESDTPYLPTDTADNAPTVAAQRSDAHSILQFVKQLIALRRAHPALWADGDYRTIKSGYPLVFERSCEGETIRVAINVSAKEHQVTDAALSKVLFAYHASAQDGKLTLGPRSCLIYTV